MLAYVFWHQPRPDVPSEAYEALLRDFHTTLAHAPPPDYQGSAAYRVSAVPWAPAGGPVYEDWYLVGGSGGLDPLNEAAVSGRRQLPHDTVAARAAWGTAGLYRLRDGRPAFAAARRALWLTKPPGVAYDAYYRQVRAAAGPGDWALWGRQMVLGPTPEFCLHAADAPAALVAAAHTSVVLQLVWSGVPPA